MIAEITSILFFIALLAVAIYFCLRSLPYYQDVPRLPAQPPPADMSAEDIVRLVELVTAEEALKHALSCELRAMCYKKELPEPEATNLAEHWAEMAVQWHFIHSLLAK